MTYQYYQSDNILSLLVHILDNEGNIDMITYNININEKRNIEESELLHHYNLNKSNIINTIETNVKKYYQYEKSKHYIESSCDLNCYKEINKIDTTTNYHLYVMNNELYIYKRFQTTPNFLYDSNLPFTPFHFKVN